MRTVCKTFVTVTLVLFTGFYARAWFESAVWLEHGHEARSNGAISESIESFRRSVSWSAPFLPYSEAALEELMEIADDNAVSSEFRTRALEEAKRGLSASRSVLDRISGRAARLESINKKILIAKPELAQPQIQEVYPPRVNYSLQLLAQLAFIGWVGMVLVAIWRGIDATGALRRRPLLISLGGFAIFFLIWIAALRWA